MIKKITLFAGSLAISLASLGQSVFPCGFDDAHKELMRTDRLYEKAVRASNNKWIEYKKLASVARLTTTSAGYVYEIPMVMHIIHTGGAVGSLYNPDSTKIAQMIDFMNKNYAAQFPFPDTTTGTSGGGCRIPLKFVLAKRTPTGAATNGIVRLDGTVTYGLTYSDYGVKRSASTGITTAQAMALSRWTPSDYYNVYIVNKIDGNDLTTTGGVAGYAYFPGYPTVDGMVVVASQVKSGSVTVAHEFGHAFNLYHTFEGDGGTATCPVNTDCTADGDLVCDTEPAYGSNHWTGWCPPTDVNPCTGSSYNKTQYNVMDYTNCDWYYPGSVTGPDRFTAGQRDRVMYALNNIRTGFIYSYGLMDPSGTVATPVSTPTSSSTTGAFGPESVKLKDIEVWTGSLGDENASYVDHAYTQQIRAAIGDTIPVVVSTATNRQNVKVYVDYNNDGDFVDAGEQVWTHNGTTSTEDHTGSFIIPSSATTCTWLRIRVVAGWYAASISDWANGPYSNNAQAEDYAIMIKNRTAADTVTIAQTVGSNPSCTGSVVTFTATPKGGSPTYKWYVNGVFTGTTTSSFSSSSLADGSVITCRTFFTGACGADSAESNSILLRVSSTASASAKISLISGTNPGCAGQSLVFKMTVSGGGTPDYAWKVNGTAVGGNVDTFATSSLAAGAKVWCRVTPHSSCTSTPVNSDTMTISFAAVVPTVSIALTSGTIPSCDSTYLTFTATPTNGGAAPKYQWYKNNVAVTSATANFYSDFTFKTGDSIWCRVISNHPCIVAGSGDTAWSSKMYVTRNTRTVPTLSVTRTKGSNPGCLDSLLEYTAVATDGGGTPTIVWLINGAIAGYGSVFGTTAFLDKDTLSCKMYVTAGSCNTVDSLVWGPEVMVRSTTPGTPVISLIGTMLVSSIPSGIQWYGPSGLIPGATGPTYHPAVAGVYYAVAVNNGCNGKKSNELNVTLLSISPYNMAELKIFPNPSTGIVNLDWGTQSVSGTVAVYNVAGQRLVSESFENTSYHTLDLTSVSNGNYFIVVRDSAGKTGTVSISVNK
ncbi:M43 family zinc metalloprotease [Rurimicrobium arvi]|uniref:T9SS type A sorting domain-containing protein n=1 Tax=Rurimicrobium arvi TaxID=2049916 RepID=A0ABP8MPH3_9BACT